MGEVRWFDNHCHLGEDAPEVIERATDAGVVGMITVGTDLAHSQAAVATAERFAQVWATAGVHPHEARDGMQGIAELLDHPKVVAVGEAGLDFHYDHSPRDQQQEIFRAHIGLANQHDLPLIIHTREAWEETFALLDAEGTPERTVFHCFTGGPDEATGCLERGAMMSFSGIVTFPKAPEVREAAALCPLERIMVETDSPYLAPVPLRGKTNQPANVALVGEKIAEVLGLPISEVAAATTASAQRFYGVSAQ